MKKQLLLSFIIFTLTLVLFSSNSLAQTLTPQFELRLYFEDAAGNRDTLIIGDDPMATNLIDTIFGEENIINHVWDSIFEVRVSNKYWENYPFADTALIQTKKQIVNKEEVGNNYTIFDIKAKNWPVVISWDSTLFSGQNDTLQYAGTWMTAWGYGQWWDAGIQPNYLSNKSQMMLSNELFGSLDLNNTLTEYYTTINNDTIYSMWFNFEDSSAFTLSVDDSGKLDDLFIFPNPFENFFNLHGIELKMIKTIRVYNLNGKEQNLQIDGEKLSLPNSLSGMYIVEIELKNRSEKYQYKLIKK